MGRSVTGISALTTEFGVSSVHWGCTNSPLGPKDGMVTLIEDNVLRRTDVYIPTFHLLQIFICMRMLSLYAPRLAQT